MEKWTFFGHYLDYLELPRLCWQVNCKKDRKTDRRKIIINRETNTQTLKQYLPKWQKTPNLKTESKLPLRGTRSKSKVQERPGTKLKNIIQKSDPFSEKGCNRNDCAVCQESTNKVNCRTRGCVYELLCNDCESHTNVKNQYRGQTSRSLYERINEHFENWKKKKEDSPLWKHSYEYYQGGTFPVEVKILKRCDGRPTKRMITEVVLIEDMKDSESLNNKKEYGYVRIPKVNIET